MNFYAIRFEMFAAAKYIGVALILEASIPGASALTAENDTAVTLPNTPITLIVLANDNVSPTNSTGILRVTQPAHGRVVINSISAKHAELTPLFQFAARQLSNTVRQVVITNMYPFYLDNGVWVTLPTNTPSCPDCNWVGGFFPGSLWLVYEYTGDTNYSRWAQEWQAALAPEQNSTDAADVSFIINTSFGNGFRITGNPAYKNILIQTCRSFTNGWNHIVGCFSDDLITPPPFETVIDLMVDTEIYYRQDLGLGTNMLLMAVSHAGRALTNNVRADGSTFQRVVYDCVTNGSVLYQDNRVSIGPCDTWARGHSWATHAFPYLYQNDGDPRFLQTAKHIADFYISIAPADYVPYWYYPSNGVTTGLLRDSSAASVTLSGLINLSQVVTNDADGAKYWRAAQNLFVSLGSTNYLAVNTTNAILLHGYPVDVDLDTPLVYGDYYFLEALKRYNDVFNQSTLTYMPATNFTGTDTFTYQACDSSGAVSTATVTVSVGIVAQISLSPVTDWPVISFPTSTGADYFVLYQNALAPAANWQILATNLSGSGSTISITDTNPPVTRFYRAGSP